MHASQLLWPTTGDVVIIKLPTGDGFEIAVCPEAARIDCESYDDAWTTARTLAETTSVDFWFTCPSVAVSGQDELRMLGHYRRERRDPAKDSEPSEHHYAEGL